MYQILITISSNKEKVITWNILRDGLKEIQRPHDTNTDAAEKKIWWKSCYINRKIADKLSLNTRDKSVELM